FEAIEQLYGEAGLSPGIHKYARGDCACGLGIMPFIQEKLGAGSAWAKYARSIDTQAFDTGGGSKRVAEADLVGLTPAAGPRANDKARRSLALGKFFRERLGEDLPDLDRDEDV